jgi:filamentous hemagglutinin
VKTWSVPVFPLIQFGIENGYSEQAIADALKAQREGVGFDGPNPAKALIQAWTVMITGPLVASELTAGFAAMALGAAISGGANTAYQMQKDEPFSYSDAFIATVVGAATQGKGFWVTQAAGVGGSLTGSVIKGEDRIPPVVGSVAGTTLGFYGGPVISNMLKPIVPESTSSVLGNMGGSYVSEALSDWIQNVVGKK